MLGGGRRRRRAYLDRERSSIRVDSDLYAPGLCGRSPHTTATTRTTRSWSLLRNRLMSSSFTWRSPSCIVTQPEALEVDSGAASTYLARTAPARSDARSCRERVCQYV